MGGPGRLFDSYPVGLGKERQDGLSLTPGWHSESLLCARCRGYKENYGRLVFQVLYM